MKEMVRETKKLCATCELAVMLVSLS